MRKLPQWFYVAACAVGPLACGYPPLSELSGIVSDAPSIDAVPPPSCIALPYTCGASGNDSCCNSLEVTEGTYYRGYDYAGDANSGNKNYPATISTFRLDKYEITVGRFRAFVAEGMGTQANHPVVGTGTHANIPGSGWEASWNTTLLADTAALIAAVKCDSTFQTWTDVPGANEDRPMNCITWYEAMAFCAWDSGYLPTEAEWNYAATGGDQQRAYPWSSPASSLTLLDSSHASYYDGTNCMGDGMAGCALTDLVSVGSKPAGDGRWGQSDLAGNVWEWTLDWHATHVNPCVNCANLVAGSYRVVRGGSLYVDATYLRTGYHDYYYTPTSRHFYIGVRCARTP